jgi:nitronate monooxygenase
VRVLADVATIQHAEKAAAAGVDGLVLLTAGAGGQTGWLNPFAFVRAVRQFFDGIVVLAGGISDGRALRAAEVLGADLAYMGTKFIATRESLASDAYREMVVRANADDIVLTKAITGLETNILAESLVDAGIDSGASHGPLDVARDITTGAPPRSKHIWSAGHSVSSVTEILDVAELVARTEAEYRGYSHVSTCSSSKLQSGRERAGSVELAEAPSRLH